MKNGLTRFDALNDLARFEPLRGVEDFFRDFRLNHALRDLDTPPAIKMDVAETEQAYTVKAELPGMKKEDIKVDVDAKRVTITAETRRDSEQKEGSTVVRSERYYGQQYRCFTLEHEIDEQKAAAKYDNGVLELVLPKKEGKQSARKITIS